MVYTATSQRMRRRRRRHLGDRHRERHEDGRVVEDQRRRSDRVGRVRDQRHRDRGDRPGTVTAGGYANAIVALDPKTLALKDWFRQPGVEFAAPPVLFQESGKDIVAVTTRDGRVLLLDAASLGGANHDTPLFASASLTGGAATFAAQSPAMWEERAPVPAAAGPRLLHRLRR